VTVTHCIPAGAPWNANQVSVPGVNGVTTVISDIAPGTRRGRCIYFPSTGALATQMFGQNNYPGVPATYGSDVAGLPSFVSFMNTDGWQMIGVDELGAWSQNTTNDILTDTPDATSNGYGDRLRQSQLNYFDHILYWCATFAPGGEMPTLVAGFSWGAWAVLQMLLHRSEFVIGGISRSSPTQWNAYPTDGPFAFSDLAGQDTSGVNLVTQTLTTVTSATAGMSGPPYLITLNGTFSGFSANEFITIQNVSSSSSSDSTSYTQLLNTPPGPTGGLRPNCSSQQLVSASSSHLAFNLGTMPTDTLTSLQVSANTVLNSLTVPLALAWGTTGELVMFPELNTIASNAIANGAPVTPYVMTGETHEWLDADSTAFAGTPTAWVQSVLDPHYPPVH
jgi:hypothetical protein